MRGKSKADLPGIEISEDLDFSEDEASEPGRGPSFIDQDMFGEGRHIFGFVVEEIEPTITNPSMIGTIISEYAIPFKYSPLIPSKGDRACWPPPGYVAVNLEMFKMGITLGLHSFVRKVLDSYRIAPAQLTPNSYNHIIGMWLMQTDLGLGESSIAEQHAVYNIVNVREKKGYYNFQGWRSGPHVVVIDLKSSHEPQKSRFVYIEHTPDDGADGIVLLGFMPRKMCHN